MMKAMFRGKLAFLSNFYPCEITYNGITYKSTEAAFQAQKTLDNDKRIECSLMDAKESKAFGNAVKCREDWENIKLTVMEDLLRLKFTKPDLRQKLLDTKDLDLVEENWWKDTFWGQCPLGNGHNHLGRLLMKIRGEYNV